MTNIAGILDAPATSVPERAALVVDGAIVTYAGLQAAVGHVAAALDDRGVRPGERVPLLSWASPLAVAGTLAAAHVGACAAPMNPLLTAAERRELSEVAGCGEVAVVASALQGPGEFRAVVTEDVLTAAASAPPPRQGGDDADALVLFTSGTTGRPKAVPMTHGAITARIAAYRPPFDPAAPSRVTLTCVPLFHVGGLLGLIMGLAGGDTTVLQPRFDAGAWLALAHEHRVTTTFLVPTMLQRILDHQDFARTDLSALASISYGAAAAPTALVQRAMTALPHVAFANVFGQTETMGAYTTLGPNDHRDPRRIGSVGRPLPGVRIRIVDPVTEADVPDGEAGELWVDSPQNVRDGWLRTGDLVRRDADGYLYPSGRLSDTINRGGEKFGPAEVADVLRTHPDVADVAVAGVADDEMGERVGVAVVPAPGVAPGELGVEALRSWCRSRLAPYKLPEIVVVVPALPYNELGKLSRRATAELIVRERAQRAQQGAEA